MFSKLLDNIASYGGAYNHQRTDQVDVLETVNLGKNNCCKGAFPSETCKVINFDDVTKAYTLGKARPSSCDALKFCQTDNRIDLVELKGIELFKQHNPNATKAEVDKHFEKSSQDYTKKLHDSYNTLSALVSEVNATTSLDSVTIRYFIVTDAKLEKDPLKVMTLMRSYLAGTSDLDVTLQMALRKKVETIKPTITIEKPRLLHCSEITRILCENNCCTPATSLN